MVRRTKKNDQRASKTAHATNLEAKQARNKGKSAIDDDGSSVESESSLFEEGYHEPTSQNEPETILSMEKTREELIEGTRRKSILADWFPPTELNLGSKVSIWAMNSSNFNTNDVTLEENSGDTILRKSNRPLIEMTKYEIAKEIEYWGLSVVACI